MQAIATLIQDDPYLKMTREQRLVARRERKEKFRKTAIDCVLEVIELPIDKTEPTAEGEWVDRQKTIHAPLPPPKPSWFAIVDEILPNEPRRPLIEEIQRACAKYYGVTRADILSARRTAQVVRPRQVGYFLAKCLTFNSLPQIARRFGGRDHTSALSGIRKIERLLKISPELVREIEAIKKTLAEQTA